MKINPLMLVPFLTLCMLVFSAFGQSPAPFTSKPLNEKGDLSSLMVEGIDRFLTGETERVQQARSSLWHREFSTPEAFDQSIASNRDLLAQRLGVVDIRVTPEMEVLTNEKLQQFKVETDACVIRPVCWRVLEGLSAEGLLLQPKGKVLARVVMIPDADVLPEVLAGLQKIDDPGYCVARQLAEDGWEVLVPVLVSREDTFSGSQLVGRFTNQPHREWIYRQGYEVGRHVIGYELQKIFAAIDWMESQNKSEGNNALIGVAGYGEGGLLALYAAALDQRISSTLISGYFDAREQLWREPIYRNVFGLLKYFGDAELAVMAWPRCLVVEHVTAPEVLGPPTPSEGRSGAAPGCLTTPNFSTAERKANPLGLTLFSVITGQHQRIVEWLGQQSFVDPARIGFYGLSYGGKTAMRVPALVAGYALSICSGDFYEWVRYNASTISNSYMFTKEYEIFEWDLGHTFNYAEMAALIAPRPFMVERGYYDNPETDEWVSYEFEKVSRHYDFIDLPEYVRIEHFKGPHTINGVGTFEFLDRYLKKQLQN